MTNFTIPDWTNCFIKFFAQVFKSGGKYFCEGYGWFSEKHASVTRPSEALIRYHLSQFALFRVIFFKRVFIASLYLHEIQFHFT